MNKELEPLPPEAANIKGHYEHYKGGKYEVIGVGRHSETLEPTVFYRSLDHGSLWARPLSEWLKPQSNGQPRFTAYAPEKPEIKFSEKGIPIFDLDRKIDALKYCIEHGSEEDSMGHLFDLLHHVVPNYRFLDFKNIKQLCDYYGKNPTPIEHDFARARRTNYG